MSIWDDFYFENEGKGGKELKIWGDVIYGWFLRCLQGVSTRERLMRSVESLIVVFSIGRDVVGLIN